MKEQAKWFIVWRGKSGWTWGLAHEAHYTTTEDALEMAKDLAIQNKNRLYMVVQGIYLVQHTNQPVLVQEL